LALLIAEKHYESGWFRSCPVKLLVVVRLRSYLASLAKAVALSQFRSRLLAALVESF